MKILSTLRFQGVERKLSCLADSNNLKEISKGVKAKRCVQRLAYPRGRAVSLPIALKSALQAFCLIE
jgi:hypothetical protein